MKNLIFILSIVALILLIISCKNKTKNDMEIDELNSFAKKYAQAWSSQKPEEVSKFFAPDGSLTVNEGEPAIGTAAITNVAKGFMDAFPDMIVTMDSLVTKSNKTDFHWTLIGTNTGTGGTGNKVRIRGF